MKSLSLMASLVTLFLSTATVGSAVEIFAPPHQGLYSHGVFVTPSGTGSILEAGDYGVRFLVDSVEWQDGMYVILGTITNYSTHYYLYPGTDERIPIYQPVTDQVAIFANPDSGEIQVCLDVEFIDGEMFFGRFFRTIGEVR